MKALFEPRDYVSDEAFARDRGLFSSSWVCVGLARDLEEGGWLRARVAGKELVVRRSGGRFRAFLNSCSHRGARLCSAERGKGALVCPYHGWAYDASGAPRGVAAEDFPEVAVDPGAFRLPEYEADAAGGFLFVRLESGGPSLRERLGPAFEALAAVPLEREVDSFREELACDWKVLVENSLESWHVPTVHAASLGSLPELEAETRESLWENGHSLSVQPASARWATVAPLLGEASADGLTHLHVFPNLAVSSFQGLTWHVQLWEPTAPGRCAALTRTFAPREGSPALESLLREGIAATRTVFAEDKRICEQVQLGLENAERPGVLAARRERRLAHFQSACLAGALA